MKCLTIVVLVLLAACDDTGKKTSVEANPKTETAAVLDQLEQFKEQACACEDAACAHRVHQELMVWVMNNSVMMRDLNADKDQDAKAQRITDEMMACKRRLGG